MITSEDDNFLRYWYQVNFTLVLIRALSRITSIDILKLIYLQDKKVELDFFEQWLHDYDKSMLEYSLQYIEMEKKYLRANLERNRKDGEKINFREKLITYLSI